MSVSTAVMGPRSTSARCGRGEAANWARKEWKIVAHLVKVRVRLRVRVWMRVRLRVEGRLEDRGAQVDPNPVPNPNPGARVDVNDVVDGLLRHELQTEDVLVVKVGGRDERPTSRGGEVAFLVGARARARVGVRVRVGNRARARIGVMVWRRVRGEVALLLVRRQHLLLGSRPL